MSCLQTDVSWFELTYFLHWNVLICFENNNQSNFRSNTESWVESFPHLCSTDHANTVIALLNKFLFYWPDFKQQISLIFFIFCTVNEQFQQVNVVATCDPSVRAFIVLNVLN